MLGIGHPHEVEQHRQRFLECRIEQHQRAGDLLPGLRRIVLGGDPEIIAIQLQDRDERNIATVGWAMALIHRHALLTPSFDELITQPALADAGFAHHPDHLAMTLACPFQRGGQGARRSLR